MMNKKQLIGLVGSAMLLIGVFTPLIRLPIVGSVNYFMNGHGDGIFIIILAIISFIAVLMKKYKVLLITSISSLGLMIFTFLNFQTRMASVKDQMQKDLAGNPFASLGDLAIQSVQFEWGWIILIIGAVLLIVSTIMPEDKRDTT